MRKYFVVLACLLVADFLSAQDINQRLQKAFQQFESDSQMKHGISSLYVIDANTGEVLFSKNEQLGFAPASTQKIITSVTSFELLGKDFHYQTKMGIESVDEKKILHIMGSGDPTFGSGRWPGTTDSDVLKRWVVDVQSANIEKFDHVLLDNDGWQTETIPDGWIWQDIGNYYGAGATGFNWRENQFDIILRSGQRIGSHVAIVKSYPKTYNIKIESLLTSAAKGSGDNAYVYYPLKEETAIIRGTIPVNEDNFKISAAFPSGIDQFLRTLSDTLKSLDIKLPEKITHDFTQADARISKIIHIETSPSLDSIIYWFLKKSINLYGEALVKTIGFQKTGVGATDSGVSVVKKFWKQKGIEPDELNMYDGSGLSPLNRITTHAQVEILKYAKSKDWFPYFFNALPIYNEMHMKSGTISDVKGFCGYHQSKDGREYIFSFLVNNYGGRTSGIVSKMYKVLDELK